MDKQTAINEAKRTALGSIGFGLVKANEQSNKLTKASRTAVKEVINLNKTITGLVAKFRVLESIVRDIKNTLQTNKNDTSKLARINSILISGGDRYKSAEAILEEKPSLSDTYTSAKKAVGKASTDIVTGLIIALPFLFSPQFRSIISNFFNGFLEGIGLSEQAVEKVKLGLTIATGAVAAGFTYNLFKTVGTAFSKVRQLAQVMGLLALNTNNTIDIGMRKNLFTGKDISNQAGSSSARSAQIAHKIDRLQSNRWWSSLTADQRNDPRNKKKRQNDVRRLEKEGKKLREDFGGMSPRDEARRAERVEQAAKAKKLKKYKEVKGLLKGGIRLGSFAAKATGIGYLIGVGVETVAGSIMDIATLEDDVQATPANIVKIIVNNAVAAATFGGKEETFKLDKSSKPATSLVQPTTAVPTAPAKPSSYNVVPNMTNSGVEIESTSRRVSAAETDQKMEYNNNIIVVDNSSILINNSQEPSVSTGSAYSISAGR